MKRSQLLAASIVALMVLAVVPAQTARASSSYSEKLNVYVAGSDALWYFTFGGVNDTSALSAFEGTAGLSSYNITAIKTTSWSSDFQAFGPRGYNLLPVPFVPSQGLFLTVRSDSYADAASAASALDSYLKTSFSSYSNGTGTYAFYSPVTFDSLVPSTLLAQIPAAEGGFVNAISASSFITTNSPFVVLQGQKSASGFTHDLVVGSITASALNSSHQPNLLGYFGGNVTSLTASSVSNSSLIHLNVLDGVVATSDKATVTNDNAKFTGSYALSLSPGKSLLKVNATVVQQPAPLLAYRTVDAGVLKTGDNLAVTLNFKDLSTTVAISKISFSDNWWGSGGSFKFLSGNNSLSQGLGSGGTITPVYRLQYIGTTAGSVTIPASVVRYQYTVNGVTFNATAVLNSIRLSLGADDAVVYATVVPTGGYGKSVGGTQSYNVTVTNVGTLAASSVLVAGQSVAGLAANSGTATVTVSQAASGVLGTNFTKAYPVSYQDPSGTTLNATSNTVSALFSHSSMRIGFPVLTVAAQVSSLANSRTNVTLSFTSSNYGAANVTSYSATGSLPGGMGCGATTGKGISCANGVVTISYARLNTSSSVTAGMKYNLSSGVDFLTKPFRIHGTDSLGAFSGASNSAAVPAGIVLSKQFNPSQLFGGMTSSVLVSVINHGPLPIYGVTVGSTVDSFDTASASAVLSKTVANLAGGSNASVSYGVTVQQVSGTQSASVPSATFFLGGASFTLQGPVPKVGVYQPLGVSITTTPTTPEEGKNFTITIVIRNPTAVGVSNVQFTLPVPSGLGLSGLVNAHLASGTLSVTNSTLGPGRTLTATASAVASSGITIPFRNGRLTFVYGGVTINGTVPKSSGIAISEDVTTRYIIPIAFILIAVVAVAFYVRRKAVTVRASQS